MSNPITNARALLASRDATAKFAGYPDHKLAEAMRELLREVERMRAEEARCIDAADAAIREDERRHAEVVQAAMERERLLEAERDRALVEVERLRSALEWFADAGHYSNTYRRGAGFVDALGLSRARCALLGIDRDDAPDDLDDRWAARETPRG